MIKWQLSKGSYSFPFHVMDGWMDALLAPTSPAIMYMASNHYCSLVFIFLIAKLAILIRR
jgi:hypothetical protein